MHKPFSHIYIEESVLASPITKLVLEKFPSSIQIPVKHYKDVFHKRGQNFLLQKESPKLILAKKEDQFLYPGSQFAPNFGAKHFYYNTLALNCIYDCAYCYLQGMFDSANIVLFVNWEDYFSATEAFLNAFQSLYLALSYDTDLLAMEGFFPATRAWLSFAKEHQNLEIEIRTKSANFQMLRDVEAIPNAIFAWTLSPQEFRESIENKTPSLKNKITSAKLAVAKGWKLRLCLDPLLREPNWKELYTGLVEELGKSFLPEQVFDISIGSFRMNSEFYAEIKKKRKDHALLFYPYERKDGIVSYPHEEKRDLENFVFSKLLAYFPEKKIRFT
ncbi:hypothetical protein LPTSP4_15960 [Leptospira ryugenii]|uniref:DNA photolyase n=1 Tax=Leptospira ryugenii TaxID=1917863 RepID=A0A2P2DZM2_9LEPT|nr:DNA photolyase [Leptospira ryugenii]GBF50073.1 hypothetical protein LPTSP4_15960 [Leptospira ryugenii]